MVVGSQDPKEAVLNVVLLHGFGAPGTDLVPLSGVLPKARYIFPAAPLSGPEFGGGRAWWPIDLETMQIALAQGKFRELQNLEPDGLKQAKSALEACLDQALARFGSGPMVLGGFSQGAMLCTEIALTTSRPLVGVILFSGTLLARQRWGSAEAPPRRVVQSHGRSDPLLPFFGAEALRDLMLASGHSVDFVPFQGAHDIPAPAVERAAKLLDDVQPSK